jgi:hypothetical protein
MSVRIWVACIVAALAAACASEPPALPGNPKSVSGFALAPFAMKEECMRLSPGDRLEYRFASDQPLRFDVHYHEGKMILTPLSRVDVSADAGIYDPLIPQDYCLTWEAGPQGATIDYRFSVRAKR